MMAMIQLWENETLKRLGWKLVLQVRDEVILEGPKESKDEVLKTFTAFQISTMVYIKYLRSFQNVCIQNVSCHQI
jgi:DNA polymerase I-like protein with 3'-5' exonuclease and polymerase domains